MTVVQTWHASGAFKKIGHSVLDRTFGADEALTSRVRIHSNYDLCLIGSQTATPHYAEAFGQPPERFVSRFGIPRTYLFSDADAIARASADVRQRYQLPSNRRVILYAPTFRGERVTRARHSEELDLTDLDAGRGACLHQLTRQPLAVRQAGVAALLVEDLVVTE